MEITHVVDAETGQYVQIVTPDHLREILVAEGETLTRPAHFRDGDEWNVAE